MSISVADLRLSIAEHNSSFSMRHALADSARTTANVTSMEAAEIPGVEMKNRPADRAERDRAR
jgi:hypothetical protein